MYFINIQVDGGFPRLDRPLLVLVQDTDAAVLADAVAHLQRIDPHGEF